MMVVVVVVVVVVGWSVGWLGGCGCGGGGVGNTEIHDCS